MANIKLWKNPICKKCKGSIERIAPLHRLGNYYGEEWNCKKCGRDVPVITITPSL